MKQALTLYELNELVAETLQSVMPDEYWVEAELSEIREVRGHCYMELIQKDEPTNTPVARASAKCWKNRWMLLRPHFERTAGQHFRPGMKVLLKVYADFHAAFGFSWIVTDIDPIYSMGDMVRKRQEIIARLKAEGVFELQKELRLPMFAQSIAVISSEQAAGYGDFVRQLADNRSGFVFYVRLFRAVMQGEQVEQSVIEALDRINERADCFDAVAIIRGGGATSDLSGFDTLLLAENVANFPLPIITGIGHDRDESILDLIAYHGVKTPTAAAAYLIDNLSRTMERITDAQDEIAGTVRHRIEAERMRLGRVSHRIAFLFSHFKENQMERLQRNYVALIKAVGRELSDGKSRLSLLAGRVHPAARRQITAEHHRFDMLCQRCRSLDPGLLLRRGYSITLHEGRAVRDASLLKKGDRIETRVEKGTLTSIID